MRLFPFNRGFLRNQKVQKRSDQRKIQKKKNSTLFLLIALLCCSAALFFKFYSSLKSSSQDSILLNPSWDISIHSNLSTNHQNVLEAFQKNKSSFISLQELSNYIQDNFGFAKTKILQPRPKKLKILLEERSPIFVVETDKSRFVSSDGEIYGLANENHQTLPKLVDFFQRENKIFTISKTNALITTEEEQERINEALAIMSLCKKYSLPLDQLIFVPYRGFKLQFRNERVEVFVGRKPFEYKFVKLIEIQKDLKQKNQNAERIELDYEGKAFIKISKIGEKVDS